MMEKNASFRLLIRNILGVFDDPHCITPAENIISFWEDISRILAERQIFWKVNHIHIYIEWNYLLDSIRKHESDLAYFEQVIKSGLEDEKTKALEYWMNPVSTPILVTISNSSISDGDYVNIDALVETHLHDLFLIINIAAPGAWSFGKTWLQREENSSSHGPPRELALSGAQFEITKIRSNEGKWPKIKHFELDQVKEWYYTYRSELEQVPSNDVEKVLFSILHICRSDSEFQSAIVWIFYALETFFATQSGENRRELNKRMNLLFDSNDKQKKYLSGILRDLYTERSKLVHGGMSILHPVGEVDIDGRVSELLSSAMDSMDTGFHLLIACLQRTIELGWGAPDFETVLRGDRLRVGKLQNE